MYVKLDCLYFTASDLKVKTTEILKYILLFPGKKYGQGRGGSFQVLRKY